HPDSAKPPHPVVRKPVHHHPIVKDLTTTTGHHARESGSCSSHSDPISACCCRVFYHQLKFVMVSAFYSVSPSQARHQSHSPHSPLRPSRPCGGPKTGPRVTRAHHPR